MAGSYNHCVADDGQLLTNENLVQMVENLGDAYEAIHEMYGMIWWLANELRESSESVPPSVASLVEAARTYYRMGIAMSPGVEGVL